MKKQFEQENIGNLLSELLADTPKERLLFVDFSMAIATQIVNILEEKGLKQKDLRKCWAKPILKSAKGSVAPIISLYAH